MNCSRSVIITLIVILFSVMGGKAQSTDGQEQHGLKENFNQLKTKAVSLKDNAVSLKDNLVNFKDTAVHFVNNKCTLVRNWCEENEVANHLEGSISVGSMGLGLEIQTPATKWVNVRAGIDWLPRFKVKMKFSLNTFSEELPTGSFNKVAQMVYDFTGIEMDETVKMYGVGSMVNFKLLADIYPVPSNRHWHITAGFYAGTSEIGKAYNFYEEKPTLVGLNLYNRAYEYFTNVTDIYDVPLLDPDLVEKLQKRFKKYGRLGIHLGDFKDGRPYIMEPAPDGSVSAKAFVNHFKPYLGGGYATDLDREGRWHLGVDLGVLFWGGAPNVINHDYVSDKDISLTKDLVRIRGKVGDYVRIIKSFPVYPVLAVRFSYSIL